LRDRLRSFHPALGQVRVEYAVAFPNVDTIDGRLPDDSHRSQVITCVDLERCREAVDRLMTRSYTTQRLGDVGMQRLLSLLLPDSEVEWAAEARARLARVRLDELCDRQVGALASLDLNDRVCVTGAAGSGKTRLAVTWARRAMLRGDRTLLTCFNVPLAAQLASRFVPEAELTVGPFYEVALGMTGLPPLEVPGDADRQWWEHEAIGHLHLHWPLVTERFDTIIIDEAQDFSPMWITLLTQLLDENGPQRILMVADPSQGIYERGFKVPTDWVRCELENNCRNTLNIATMLEQRFNGGHAPAVGPETEDIAWVEASDLEAMVEAVGEAIDRVLDERDHAAQNLFVGTFTSSVRDRLRDEYSMVSWEDMSAMDILCENVHRVKGLEYDHVILVAHTEDISNDLLYVGASRAVMSLTVIGPKSIGERMGLTA